MERAEELKLRIKKLVTILVDELKEKKKGEELQVKLKEDIQLLSEYSFSSRSSLIFFLKVYPIEISNTFRKSSTISHRKMRSS